MPENVQTDSNSIMQCQALRRFGALFYDSLLVLAVLFMATMPLLYFTEGEAIHPHNYFYSAYLITVIYVFYAWFWTHGGQTLGMRAWKIRVEQANGRNITWLQSLIRFSIAMASLGIALVWCIFDRQHQPLYDKIAKTRMVRVSSTFVPG